MNYLDYNDNELLYMVSEDTDYSYDILYKKYLPIIKSFAKKYVSLVRQSGGDFDDLIQEGYLGLHNAISNYKDGCNTIFYTYACICVERKMQAYCRGLMSKKNSTLNLALPDIEYSVNVVQDSSFFSSFYTDSNEFLSYLFLQSYTLDLNTRCVFELRFNGFTYREISKLLDMPLSTVDSKITKIRQFFRKELENYELN